MISVAETVEVDLDSIKPYPGNAKLHDDVLLAASVKSHGQYRAIGVQRSTGYVIYGNGTYKALRANGAPAALVHYLDVDDEEARRINLIDNRAPERAGYDEQALVDLLQSLPSLDDTGFEQPDLDALIAKLAEAAPVDADPDACPAAPTEPVTKRGDVWLLGAHRVMCGDSKAPTDLDRLYGTAKVGCVLTDPPYGMNLDTDYSKLGYGSPKAQLRLPKINREIDPHGNLATLHRKYKGKEYRKVEGDDEPFDAGFLRAYFAKVKEQFWFGADYYRRTLSESDLDGSWLVWDKRNEASDPGFGSGFELLWSATRHKRDLLRHYYFGVFGTEGGGRVHPTQKPTGLLVAILERWAEAGCIVADPYLGSGSTVIACEKAVRVCYGLEIDPLYVDVICRRYQEFTGREPVLEATGEAVSFVEEAA